MNPITAAGFFDAGQPGYYLLILAFFGRAGRPVSLGQPP